MVDPANCKHEKRETLTASKEHCLDCGEVFPLSWLQKRKVRRSGKRAAREMIIR